MVLTVRWDNGDLEFCLLIIFNSYKMHRFVLKNELKNDLKLFLLLWPVTWGKAKNKQKYNTHKTSPVTGNNS